VQRTGWDVPHGCQSGRVDPGSGLGEVLRTGRVVLGGQPCPGGRFGEDRAETSSGEAS
jgi:hypothetical protein